MIVVNDRLYTKLSNFKKRTLGNYNSNWKWLLHLSFNRHIGHARQCDIIIQCDVIKISVHVSRSAHGMYSEC